MSITDELREWKGHIQTRLAPEAVLALRGELNAIADHIDAEHEAMLADARKAVYQDYVALPKDVDGEPIRIGDVMENTVCPSVHREVTGVGVECFYGWDEGNGRYSQFSANRYRHHKPDTFASIIEDAIGDRIENRAEFDKELDALVARCKALAGDAE